MAPEVLPAFADEPTVADHAGQRRARCQDIERDQHDGGRFVGVVPGVMIAAVLAVESQEHQARRIERRHERARNTQPVGDEADLGGDAERSFEDRVL